MNATERYYWDLNGHLVIRNVLTSEEVVAANAALDYLADRCANGTDEDADFLREAAQPRWMDHKLVRTRNNIPYLLMLKPPHCDPFRKMIVHSQIVSRLQVMCGKGFRLDHGPQFIGGFKGTPRHTLHGAGEPYKPYVAYHNQNGRMYVGGVTVTYNLADSGPDDGGFACVPGSHKSRYRMPGGVSSMDDDTSNETLFDIVSHSVGALGPI